MGNAQRAEPASFRWLCEHYCASAKFRSLAPSTQTVRRGMLDRICEQVGDYPYLEMESRHVAKLRDEKSATPEAANNPVKILRQLFTSACSTEYHLAEKNPARRCGKVAQRQSRWNKGVDRSRCGALRGAPSDRHESTAGLRSAALHRGTSSDVVQLGAQLERWFTETLPDGTTVEVQKLIFSEAKGASRTVKMHALPILPPLRQSIAAAKPQVGHLVYLVTTYGKPHSVKGFGTCFKIRCRQAGIGHLSAHGLRKLVALRCAEAGATEHQLMALFGWTNPQQAAVCTRKANRAKLESSAAVLLQAQNRNA